MSIQSNYPRPDLNRPDAKTCPQCGQRAGKRIRYTWWGGAIGPSMMSLTKCQACGYQFNSITGQSTKKAVLVYNLVVVAISISVLIASYFRR